jgi:hypothetical protein
MPWVIGPIMAIIVMIQLRRNGNPKIGPPNPAFPSPHGIVVGMPEGLRHMVRIFAVLIVMIMIYIIIVYRWGFVKLR